MRILMILLLAITLGGCASQDKRELPDWSSAIIDPTEVTDPESLPPLCQMKVIDGADGARHGTWSNACWNIFAAFEIVAEGNTEIAQANADALRKTEAGYNSLVKAGEMQQQLTEFYDDLLKEERREHFMDNWIYRILIALGIVAATL